MAAGGGRAAISNSDNRLSKETRSDASTDLVVALRKGLKETGYVEGQNLTIEYRWAENQQERLSALAADLVRQRCVVIVAGGVNAAFAAS